MTTHAELVAAVEKARYVSPYGQLPGPKLVTAPDERDAHLDTLAAILNLHTSDGWEECQVCTAADSRQVPWPCPTVGIAADALRKMGAL